MGEEGMMSDRDFGEEGMLYLEYLVFGHDLRDPTRDE